MTKAIIKIVSEPSAYIDCLIESVGIRINKISITFNGSEPCKLSVTVYTISGGSAECFSTRLILLDAIKEKVAEALDVKAATNIQYTKETCPGKLYLFDPTRAFDFAIKAKFIEQLNHCINIPTV